jgi:hypothetical protein
MGGWYWTTKTPSGCWSLAGRMIVVIDDEDRENEGDLTMAACPNRHILT